MFMIPNKQKQNHVHNSKLTNTKWQMQSQTFYTLLLLTSQCFANVVPFEVSWHFFQNIFFYFGGLWKLLSQKFRPSWVSDKIMQNRYPLLLMMKINWSELWPSCLIAWFAFCLMGQSWKHISFVQTLTGKLILNWSFCCLVAQLHSFYCLVAQCTRLWRSRLRWKLQNGNALEEIGSIISPPTTFRSMDTHTWYLSRAPRAALV